MPSAALVLIGGYWGENEAANNRRKEKIPDESNQVFMLPNLRRTAEKSCGGFR